MEEYLAEIVKSSSLLGYHLERKRERSGKISRPLPFIFDQVIETHLRNPEDIEDIIF